MLIRPTVAFVSATPRASGLRSPLASVSGPSPKKIVSPLPAKTFVPSPRVSNVRPPPIVTPPPISRLRLLIESEKTGDSAGPKRIAISRPSTMIVSSTAPPVVLTRTTTVAEENVPETYPATPVGVIRSAPSPAVTVWVPIVSVAPSIPTNVSALGPLPLRWKKNIPSIVPSPPTPTGVPETEMESRTKGPAGSASDVTAVGRVFSSSEPVYDDANVIVGTGATVTVALNEPASPSAASRSCPLPVALATAPIESETLCASTVTTPALVCSNENVPERVSPATTSEAGVVVEPTSTVTWSALPPTAIEAEIAPVTETPGTSTTTESKP